MLVLPKSGRPIVQMTTKTKICDTVTYVCLLLSLILRRFRQLSLFLSLKLNLIPPFILGLPRSLLPVGLYFRSFCGSLVFPILWMCVTQSLLHASVSWIIHFYVLYASPNIWVIKLRRIRRVGHVARMERAGCIQDFGGETWWKETTWKTHA